MSESLTPGNRAAMEESTALDIGREWLRKVRASDERLVAVADTLQRATPDPEAHAIAEDDRLALLAKNGLYIAILDVETEDVTTVKIERVGLSADRVRLSLGETYEMQWDRRRISYIWRAEFDGISEPLEFKSTEPYGHLRESDNPGHAFWWRLAEAIGWTKPSAHT